MYLIPRELYLKVLSSCKKVYDDDTSEQDFFTKKSPLPTPMGYKPFYSKPFFPLNDYGDEGGEGDGFFLPDNNTEPFHGFTNEGGGGGEPSRMGESVRGGDDNNFNSSSKQGRKSDNASGNYFSPDEEMQEEKQEQASFFSPPQQKSFFENLKNAFYQYGEGRGAPPPSDESSSKIKSSSSSNKSQHFFSRQNFSNDNYPSFATDFAREKIDRPKAPAEKKRDEKIEEREKPQPESPTSKKGGGDYPSFDEKYAKEEVLFKKPLPREKSKKKSVSSMSVDSTPSSTKSSQKKLNKTQRQQQALMHIERIVSTPTSDIDCYIILDIQPGWTNKELSSAFKKISQLIHPDKCNDPRSTQAFQMLQNAVEKCKSNRDGLKEELLFRKFYQQQHQQQQQQRHQQQYEEYMREMQRQNEESERERQKRNEEMERKRQQTAEENQRMENLKKRAREQQQKQQQQKTDNMKKRRGPPTTTYSSSPLRPPPGASAFNKQYGNGLKQWLKL